MSRQIVIQFVGDPSSLNRAASSAEKSTSKLGGAMKGAAKAGAVGLAVAAGGAAVAMYDMAKAAAEDEAAAAKLAQTFKNVTGASDGQIASVEKWITAQGRSLGVADDELRPALERLVTATGDVGKAQSLASLAMDVSAGTGKSLEQVSTALMKAQNGQVSGLSKLGIKTKDAEGKTISFREAVKQMGDTFGGQAATKANTFQGKMDRLKLIFGETKEEIGAKLLPVILKMSDWFLKKGLPAISKFGGWIQENLIPAFKRFGGEGPGALDKIKKAIAPVVASVRGLVRAVIPIARELWSTFKKYWGPIKAWAKQNFGVIKEIVTGQVKNISLVIKRVTQGIQFIWKRWGKDILKVATTIFKTIGSVISGALKVIRGVVKVVTGALSGDWRKAWSGIKDIVGGAWKVIRSIVSGAFTILKTITRAAWGAIKDLFKAGAKFAWEKIKDAFDAIRKKIAERLADAKNIVRTALESVKGYFRDKLNDVWTKVKDVFGAVVTKVRDSLGSVWTKVKDTFSNVWTKVKDSLNSVGTKVRDTFNGIWSKIKGTADSVWKKVKAVFIDGLPNAAKSAKEGFEKWWKKLEGIAKAPVNFIIRTVYNQGIRKVVNAIPGVPDIGPIGTFARGGPVRGGIRGRDSVHALLMPDEHVLTTEEVKAAGGHRAIYRLRQLLKSGGIRGDLGMPAKDEMPLPRFANGGTFSDQQIANAQSFARAQAGKPYVLGGVGPGGYDCSGFMSAITNVLLNRYPYSRLGTASTFPWSGFKPGYGQFSVGAFTDIGGGITGHVAGTLGGMNVESTNGSVRVGSAARGAGDSIFTRVGHLGASGGGGGGGGNWNPFGWVDDIKKFFTKIKGWIGELGKMGGWGGLIKEMAKSVANAVVSKINGMVPGSPIPTFDRGGIWTGGHALNRSGQPERVLSPSQTRNFERLVNGSGGGITINFNVPIDPVAAGREVEKVLVKFQRHTGRPLAVRTV